MEHQAPISIRSRCQVKFHVSAGTERAAKIPQRRWRLLTLRLEVAVFVQHVCQIFHLLLSRRVELRLCRASTTVVRHEDVGFEDGRRGYYVSIRAQGKNDWKYA